MTNPASGVISLSQINNAGTTTNSMGSLVNEVIAGNSAAGQTVSMSDYYFTQSYTQQAILQGTPKYDSGQGQGSKVTLSADGNTMATVDFNYARAYIFARSGSTWTFQATFLSPTNSSNFGQSLGLSADGNTLVIGNPLYSVGLTNPGSAYVYTRSGTTWSLQQQLTYTGSVGTDVRFGQGAAISSDGNTIAIGAIYDNSQKGKVWIYTRSGSTWTQQTYFSSNVSPQQFGYSTALSADGNVCVVGTNQLGQGAYVYTRSGTTWTQAAWIYAGWTYGNLVAVSADGKTIFGTNQSGGPLSWGYYNGTTWESLGQISYGINNFAEIALSADGNFLLAGVPFGVSNEAFTFTRTGTAVGSWAFAQRITLPSNPNCYFGSGVALGDNGNTMAIGAQQYEQVMTPRGGAVVIYT